MTSWQGWQTTRVLRRFLAMRATHAGWLGPGLRRDRGRRGIATSCRRLPAATGPGRQIIRHLDLGRRQGADSGQNGAWPWPVSDIKICVARRLRVPVTVT
jgi:hypothetical protein